MIGVLLHDRYRVERLIGGGGMAVVYAGSDERLHRRVAVKLLADNLAADAAARQRFVREGRLAARLSHPGVVGVYDAGTASGRPFIVMELVEGTTLADELVRRGRIPPDEVATIGASVATALAHAHEAGLVHRDVKPANVLLGSDGEVKITDFGIAAAADEGTRLTETGTVLGTAAYLAPEQADGREVGPPADVYALGVLLYELLTGDAPRPAATLAEVAMRRNAPVAPPSEREPAVPPWLDGLVLGCLVEEPSARPSASEVASRLRGEAPTRTSDGAATEVLPGRRPRRRWPAVLAAVAVALVTAGVVAGLTQREQGSPPAPRRPAVHAVPHADRPSEQARLLARWLERYSR